MNTQICTATGATPYSLVFGKKSRINRSILRQLSQAGITEEEDIPDDVVIEDVEDVEGIEGVEESSQLSVSIDDQTSEAHINIDELPGDDHVPENDGFMSEDDDEIYIEQCHTGLFIQDTMMYKPFAIVPPSPHHSTYVFRLDTWIYGMLRPNSQQRRL